jgi:hypothetical protein
MSIFSFKSKNDAELSSFDLSYHYHDPAKEEIIVYNNGKGSKGPVRLVVNNAQKQQFSHTVERIASRTGVLLKMTDFLDQNENSFSGQLLKVEIYFDGKKAFFVPEGNKFKRIK